MQALRLKLKFLFNLRPSFFSFLFFAFLLFVLTEFSKIYYGSLSLINNMILEIFIL